MKGKKKTPNFRKLKTIICFNFQNYLLMNIIMANLYKVQDFGTLKNTMKIKIKIIHYKLTFIYTPFHGKIIFTNIHTLLISLKLKIALLPKKEKQIYTN